MDKKQYLSVAVLGLLVTTLAVSASTFAFGGRGMGAGKMAGVDDAQRQKIEAVQQSITNNDYSAWQTAVTARVAEMRQQATDLEAKINQDTFNKLTQAHQLMQDGKRDEAKVIFDELGMFGPMGHMGGKGMSQGMGLKAEAPTND